MEWYEFKKSFTQQQEDALWQYFIDHSRVQPNGYFLISFYVKDIDDFWKRLKARADGTYKRYEIKDKETKQAKYEKIQAEIWHYRKRSQANQEVCEEIDKNGSYKEKVILWLYRMSKRRLFK